MVRALRMVRSVTARRQLRWIVWGTALGSVPFVFGYALPFAFGLQPLRGFEFSALLLGLIPLAFASAIVRYRLMDVEVIIKRGLVYAAALAFIAAIYAILLSDRRRDLPARRRPEAEPGHRAARDIRGGAAVASGQERDSDRAGPGLLPRPLRLPARAGRFCPRPQQRSGPAAAQRAPGPPDHRDAGGRPHGADAGAAVGRRRLRDHRACRVPRPAAAAVAVLRGGHATDRGAHARARRNPGLAPPGHARSRFLARSRDPLLRSVRLEGRHDRGHGARPQGDAPSR